MKYVICFALSVASATSIFSQAPSDTMYCDEMMFPVAKSEAKYYRTAQKLENGYEVTYRYLNGTIAIKGIYSSLQPLTKSGTYTAYRENGLLEHECHYKNNKLQGEYRTYSPNADSSSVWLFRVNHYDNGELDGSFITYDEQQRIRRNDVFKAGKLVTGKCIDENGTEIAYFPPDEMPGFIGGEVALAKFLQSNIRYPEDAKRKNVEGKVYLTFLIDEFGNLTQARIIRKVFPSIDNECLRVVNKMPRWKPGTQEGKPIKVQFRLPIEFALH